jgi:hypothetical protein
MAYGEVDSGTGGDSARREHERRRTRRHARVTERNPRTAKLRLAFAKAPQSETAWATGAAGEQLVAESLASGCGEHVVLLHDRRIPGSRANIDHLAIGPSGVWVIDTKNYKGKVRIERRMMGSSKLRINGRDRTKLVDGLDRQVSLVRASVDRLDFGVPIHGALCFVGADLPLFGTLQMRDYSLLRPRKLAKRLSASGPLPREQVSFLARELAQRFPPA